MRIKRTAVSRSASTAMILILIVSALLTWFPSTKAQSGIALDGSKYCANANNNRCTISLTTLNANDVVLAVTADESGGGLPSCGAWASLPTDSILTWHNRSCSKFTGSTDYAVRVDYAIATSPISGDSITCNSYNRVACEVFGVSGANVVTPWESNNALPCQRSGTGTTASCTISTASPNDMILGFLASYSGVAPGSGFVCLNCQGSQAAGAAATEYKIVSSLQSSLSVQMTAGSNWAFIVDAIQVGSTSSTTTSSSTTSTSTSTTLTSSSSTSTISSTSSGAPPSLDGTAGNGCGYVTACSVSLTTTRPSDIILVGCNCLPLGGPFSVKDSAGLSFSARTPQLNTGGGQFVQEWYAISSSPLTQDIVSVVTPLTGETWYGVVAFAVSGANVQNPFDGNPSLPKLQANINCPGSNPCNTDVSTTGAADFVFQFGGDTGYDKQTAGAGFTLIGYNAPGANAYAQYEIASVPLKSATLSFGTSEGWDFGVIADAIQPAPVSTTTTTATTSTTTPLGGGNDWPSFTLNLANTRYQSNSTLTSTNIGQISQKWVIPTQKSVTSTPVVLNGNVYFADWGGNVYSASVISGHLNWKANLGPIRISSSLALSGGMVYVGTGLGQTKVYALSQADGHTVWSTSLITTMDAVWASPIVFNGRVYIGVASNGTETNPAMTGAMFALDATTGIVDWSFNTVVGSTGGAGVWGSVAVDPGLNAIYFGTGNPFTLGTNSLYSQSIISLNAATGSLNWYFTPYNPTVSADLDFGSTPNLFTVAIGGVIHQAVGLGSKDGNYYILDRTDGNFLESISIGISSDEGGIIGLSGFLYAGTNQPEVFVPSLNSQIGGYFGVVKAISPSDGSVKWQFNLPGQTDSSIVVIPGAVLIGDNSGNLYAISIATGGQLLHLTFGGSIAGGIAEAEGFIFVPVSFGSSNGLCAFSYP